MQGHNHPEGAESDHHEVQWSPTAMRAYERFWEHQLLKLKINAESAHRPEEPEGIWTSSPEDIGRVSSLECLKPRCGNL
jgi:hypothetical protein